MKKFFTISAAILLLMAAGTVRAQDAPPPQYDRPAQQQADDDDAAPQPDQNQADQIQIQDQAADSVASQQQQQQDQQQQQQDVAAQPGVARVSSIRGDVSTQRSDTGEWVAATQNTPLAQGDRVSTGDQSRAELQLDFADTLRMSSRVTVKIANLTRSQIQLQVGQGLTTYSVSRGSEASTEIDTPNAAIRPMGEGEYRILVNSDAETQVIIRRGSAEISTPQGSTRVDAGQMITIAGTDNAQYRIAQAPGRDDWDNWNSDRDRAIANAEGRRNTNRYYTGSEDLDTYGRWTTVPDYGRVWVPNVAPGWAPYRAGRWVWQPYFGWTWVSYESWGWAPYHYGRWLPYGAGWAWWPGPVATYPAYYPVWAPAYVSFFGFGGGGFGVGFGFGFGYGHVGWLPCGPGDWYHPWYGRYGGSYRAVGVGSAGGFHNGWAPLHGGAHGFSNVNAALHNDHVRAGMSSMDSRSFGRGTVPAHQSGISAGEFHNASMVSGKMPVTPGKGSYSSSSREASPSTIRSASSSSQHFYSSPRMNARSTPTSSRSTGSASTARGGNENSAGSTAPNRNSGAMNRPETQPHTTAPSNSANRGGAPTSTARPGGDWHTFTPPSTAGANRTAPNTQSGGRGPMPVPGNRGGYGSSNGAPRTYQPPNTASRGGYGSPNGASRTYQPPNTASRGGYGSPNGAPRTYQPPNSASRGGYPGSAGRPPLNMRQPIVGPRGGSSSGSSGSRGGSNNGSRGGNSHGGGGGGSHKH